MPSPCSKSVVFSNSLGGQSEKFRRRVAVKLADRLIHRDQEVRGQGYELRDKEVKQAKAEDVDKAEIRMQRGSVTRGGAAQSRDELAKSMVRASGAGVKSGSLGQEAKGLLQLPSVKDLCSDDESSGEESGEIPAGSTPTKRKAEQQQQPGSGKRGKTEEGWVDHGKIMAAIKTHREWTRKMRGSLLETQKEVQKALDKVTQDVRTEVTNELNLLENRRLALRLVMGMPASEARMD